MKKRFAIPLWLVAVVVALVLARIALPYVVRDQLNRQMAEMGDYSGRVADVDLALWRGAYSLHGVEIDKVAEDVPIPFFLGPRTDISLSWRNLFRGRIVGEIAFVEPEVNFVDGRGEGDSQAGEGVDWRAQLEEIVPFEINELVVRDGTVRFNNLVSQPPIDVAVEALQVRVENLSNVQNRHDPAGRVATLEGSALVLGQSPLEVHAEFDPLGRTEDFDLHLRVEDVALTELNDLAREYASIDFESGHGQFVMELQARDGMLDGYATPLFQEMRIFSWESDVVEGDGNPLQVAWEATVEAVTSVFRNQPEDQFATRVPIRGSIDDSEAGVFRAVLGVLRNAFVEAYRADFERLEARPADDGG